jgi:hypothetical protein
VGLERFLRGALLLLVADFLKSANEYGNVDLPVVDKRHPFRFSEKLGKTLWSHGHDVIPPAP